MLFTKAGAQLVPLCSSSSWHHVIHKAAVGLIYNQLPSWVRVCAENKWKEWKCIRLQEAYPAFQV